MFYLIYVLLHTHYWAQKALGNSLLADEPYNSICCLGGSDSTFNATANCKNFHGIPQLFKIGEGLYGAMFNIEFI